MFDHGWHLRTLNGVMRFAYYTLRNTLYNFHQRHSRAGATTIEHALQRYGYRLAWLIARMKVKRPDDLSPDPRCRDHILHQSHSTWVVCGSPVRAGSLNQIDRRRKLANSRRRVDMCNQIRRAAHGKRRYRNRPLQFNRFQQRRNSIWLRMK